jgi:uncharacterized membrane protein
MRSFISSFERIRKIRTVPLQPWVRVLAVGVVAAVVMRAMCPAFATRPTCGPCRATG